MATQTEEKTAGFLILKSFMSPLRRAIAGCFLVTTLSASGQQVRFFRIVGPTAATITAFQPDGTVVWSNAQPGVTYTVQTTASLPGGTNWVDYVQLPLTQAVNTNKLVDFNPPSGMAFIPAGSFTMGDSLDGEIDAIPTNVMVSAFYMDANLVSYSQWQSVYSYAMNNGYNLDHPPEGPAGKGRSANNPVYYVDWYDCVKWCNARSQQAGLTPMYYTDAGMTQVFTNGETDAVYVNWSGQGYRLPTEAEWEKAARGGLSGQRFPWGNFIDENLANYNGDTNDFSYDLGPNGFNPVFGHGAFANTNPGGSFEPNDYGLYDMAGNLWEWCWDWYWEFAQYAGGTDPRGPSSPDPQASANRVLRGGSWSDHAYYCRTAFRFYDNPLNYYTYGLGFRSVLRSGP